MIPEIYKMLLAKQVTRTERIGAKLNRNPHLQDKYDNEVKKLEEMKACWSDTQKEKLKAVKGKPKASRKRSSDPLRD